VTFFSFQTIFGFVGKPDLVVVFKAVLQNQCLLCEWELV